MISCTDLSPIPVRSAAKSYLTSWCIQNLFKRAFIKQFVHKLDSMRWFSHRCRSAPEDGCQTKYRPFSFFVPGDLNLCPLTLTFELGRDFCTVHLTAKFHRPTFNRSEVIVLTNKRTNRRRWKHPPRSAMLRRWVNNNNNVTGVVIAQYSDVQTFSSSLVTVACECCNFTRVIFPSTDMIFAKLRQTTFGIFWNWICGPKSTLLFPPFTKIADAEMPDNGQTFLIYCCWYVTWPCVLDLWPLTFWPWSVVIHGGSYDQSLHQVWRSYGYPFLSYEFWHPP